MSVPMAFIRMLPEAVSAKPGANPRKYTTRSSAALPVQFWVGLKVRSASEKNGRLVLSYASGMDCLPPWMIFVSPNVPPPAVR